MDKRTSLLTVFLCAVLLSLPWIGERRFYTRGEPREAVVPQKMIETSNWILPRTFDNRIPSKPPFTHWLMGLSAGVGSLWTGEFRMREWSARLPAAVAGIGFLILFFCFIQPRLGTERALHSSLILLTTVEWIQGLVSTRVDTVLSVLLGIALISLYSFGESRSIRSLVIAVCSLAAATLTKGPVALVLPAMILLIYAWSDRRSVWDTVKIGIQVFVPALCIAGVWYLLAWQTGGEDFLDKFWYENIERFASSTEDKPHEHSDLYLLLMLVVGLLPWSLLVAPPIISRIIPTRRISRFRVWWAGLHSSERFSLIVIVLLFVFFSIPSSKRAEYLIPSFPFAALILSRTTVAGELSQVMRRTVKALALLVLLFLAVLTILVGLVPERLTSDPAMLELFRNEQYQLFYRPVSWMLLGLLAWRTWQLWRRTGPGARFYLDIAFFLVVLCSWLQGPLVTGYAETVGEHRLAAAVNELDPSLPLYSYKVEFYGTIFYSGRPASLVGSEQEDHGLILVRDRDYPQFVEEFGSLGAHSIIARPPGSVIKLGDEILIIEFRRH